MCLGFSFSFSLSDRLSLEYKVNDSLVFPVCLLGLHATGQKRHSLVGRSDVSTGPHHQPCEARGDNAGVRARQSLMELCLPDLTAIALWASSVSVISIMKIAAMF